MKKAFTEAPVLIHFDPSKPIRVETDTSRYTIASILSQPSEGQKPRLVSLGGDRVKKRVETLPLRPRKKAARQLQIH